MPELFYVIKRGKAMGTVLTPHRHADGCYVVSLTRYEKDYVRVGDEQELSDWIAKGYSVRMSNQGVESCRSPSLISPGSIERRADSKPATGCEV